MDIPVYLVNGFLEGGKTSFLRETLQDENFSQGESTLLILTEEGIEELDKELLEKTNSSLVIVENEEDLTEEFFKECNSVYKPERVLIECNGMWQMETFFNMPAPKEWIIVQLITLLDYTSLELYLNNMKSMVIDKIGSSNMIIVNRCDEDLEKLQSFRRTIKAVNRGAAVYFENKVGQIMDLGPEELPYDLKAKVIEINDEDFGIWYIDALDNPKNYNNKTIKIKGMVYNKPEFPKGNFVFGRLAMTCCEDDISFVGVVAKYEMAKTLKHNSWITLTAKVKYEFNKERQEDLPILVVQNIEPAKEPEDKVTYFN